ncbi:MAG: hypothetical protein ACTSSH_13685 [Candidatus Heimdallarchaeota archaeon]
MVLEILAYISVGLIVAGWVAALIFDLIKKRHSSKPNKGKLEQMDGEAI